MNSIVIMGVAGCGKSSLGAVLAQACHMAMLEGDDYHSAASREKMRQGFALTDADRDGWLSTLGEALRAQPQGLIVTCSALKHRYRERLRQAAPALRFVFLDLDKAHAHARVAARAPSHFFASSLVDSQFATLESPVGEPDVLRVDAMHPLADLQTEVSAWLHLTTEAL